jgi:hypothetical protein
MMTVIRTDDNAFRDFLFQQLGFLIGIVKQHIRQEFSKHCIYLYTFIQYGTSDFSIYGIVETRDPEYSD